MFSLEELFYRVDNFCQAFEPRWQQQLLTHHLQSRQRARQLCLSEIMTKRNCVSPTELPHVQRLLPQARLLLLESSVSGTRQLSTFCQLDALGLVAVVCLFALMFWVV